MVAAYAFDHLTHKVLLETFGDTVLRVVAFVDQQVQQLIHIFVGEAQLILVRLTLLEIRGRRLVYDHLGHPQRAGELPQLCFV